MSLLISFFGGMLLGRFRVFILVPTTLILLFFVVIRAPDSDDLRAIILLAGVIIIALQMGYLSGIFVMTKVAGRSRSLEPLYPLVVSVTVVILTTIALATVDALWGFKHVIMVYLLPAALVAICYGSEFAVFTSVGSGITAAYILLPPKFSLQIDDYSDIVELKLFVLLALITSKAVEVLARER